MASRGRSSNSGGRSFGGSRSSGGFSGSRSYGGSRSYRGSYSGSRSYGSSYGSGYGLGYLLGILSGKSSNDSTSEESQTTNGVKYKRVKNKKATTIVSVILGAITAFFIVMSIFGFGFRYGTVMGTVESVYDVYMYGEKYYFTSYRYEIDGRVYSAESQSGWTMLPEPESTYIGSEYELYYEKDDPYVIYEVEDKANMPSAEGIYQFFAVVFGVATACVAFIGIGKQEIDQEHIKAQEQIAKQTMPEGKRRCEYCQSIIDENGDKCPNCGAPLK